MADDATIVGEPLKAKEVLSLGEVIPPPSQGYITQAEQRSLNFLNPKLWQAMQVAAQTWIVSKALPSTIQNTAQLMLVLQASYEAGMQPVEGISSFYIVNGKVTMYGDAMISQVIRAGHRVEFPKCDNLEATCKITRGDNGQDYEQTITIAEMQQAGVTTKEPWRKYPRRMLKYKAFAEVAHFIVPEALRGIGIAEEYEEFGDGRPADHLPDAGQKVEGDQAGLSAALTPHVKARKK